MKVTKLFQHQDIQGFKFGSSLFKPPRIFSHVYFIDGLLIDTGHPNMRQDIIKTLKDLPVKQILITHHHEDHSGNIKVLQNHFNCPVYTSKKGIELLKKPPKISPGQYITWGKAPAYHDAKIVGQIIKTPRYTFEVIDIPGHAIDMIGLYERSQGWLFSADLYVHYYIRFFMRPESMKTQIASIKKVLQLDFKALLCSHNPQFEGGREKLQQKLAFFEDFYSRVADLYHQGNSPKVIFNKMKLKPGWINRILTLDSITSMNMVLSVIRDEQTK